MRIHKDISVPALVLLALLVPISAALAEDVVVVHASDISTWLMPPDELHGAVLVCPGGTLNTSSEARRTSGAFSVDCLAAEGFRAVNLAPDDFAKGLAAIGPLLKKGPFISANLKDRAGNRVAAASIIVPTGTHKIGITGVATAPAADDPVAKAFSADLTAADPVASLKDVADELFKASDVHVLLVYGSPMTAATILHAYPQFQLCIVASGSASSEVIHSGTAALVQSPMGGQAFGVTTLPGGNATAATMELRPAPLVVTATLQKVYQQNHLATTPAAGIAAPPPAPAVTQTPVPDHFPENGVLPMVRSASNRGAKVTATMCRLTGEYGSTKPPPGSQFLVVTTSWENIIPLTLIAQREIPTVYMVPKLTDNLYLVVNNSRVAPLAPDAQSLPGHLEIAPFKIEKLGETVRGNLVFVLPPGPIRSLELRFYDYAHGHFTILIVAGPKIVENPLIPALKNQVIEAGLYKIEKPATFAGAKPREGMEFLMLDLRARSVLFTQADASAFNPKAAKGAKLAIGTVADWKESRKYMQVLSDGDHSYLPLSGSDLPDAPRFLPDLMTGGTVTFMVPADSHALELRCDFPNAALPNGSVVRPVGLNLPIEGTRPAPPAAKSLAGAKDEIFDVSLVGQQAVSQFGGKNAGGGRKFYVLDVLVKNLGKQQEFFQPKEQLKYTDAHGGMSGWDEATLGGLYPPTEQMYIPAGDRRAFQIAYQIGADETRPRVAYSAVTEGASKVMTLPPLEARVAVTPAPEPAAPASPPPSPANPTATPGPTTPTPAPQPASPPPVPAPMKQVATATPPPDPATAPPVPAPPAAADTGLKPRPHGAARGIAGVGLTPEKVNEAIDRGMKALWAYCAKKDAEDGALFGDREEDVLCALALVHADAHKKIPEFDAALRAYLTRVDPSTPPGSHQTYVNGLLCMLIQAYGDPAFDSKLRMATRWLLESEGPDGTWTYDGELPKTLFDQPQATGALQVRGGLPPGAQAERWTRNSPWPKDAINGDNSCTQYAMLGLQSSASSGIRLPVELWKRALATARQRQGVNSGGWDYHETGEGDEDGYGSMTAAGICAVAMCRYQLDEKDYPNDPAIIHGLAWMDKHFAVDVHPRSGSEKQYVYYWLYSVERVGRMLDTDFIGIHEWYPEGAAWLVGNQAANGLWNGLEAEEAQDTRLPSSFALLFLTRATPPLKPIERHGPGMLKTAAVAPNNRFYIILDCSGSMIDNMDGKLKFDIARGSVQSLIDALPPNSEVALRVYGHRKSALDPDCDTDTELKIPMGPLEKDKFTEALNSLRARGKTPLALSINEAIKDLGEIDEKSPVTLLLLTDGGEDTFKPRGNPMQACEDLAKVKNLKFHIVGFDINQPEWSSQLQAMAQAAGARYWPAAHGADLERSVRNAVLGIPEQLVVSDADGHPVKTTRFGDSVSLAPGKYRMSTTFAGRPIEQEFYISPDETTSITFDASQIPPGPSPAPAPPVATAPPAPAEAPSTWPKFCSHCGAPLKPGQKFCSVCGTKVVPK
jgi:hypothetical protein